MWLRTSLLGLSILCWVGCSSEPPTAGGSEGAVQVYRDPETGELIAPPRAARRGLDVTDGASAATPPALAVRPGTSSAGGVILDLGGALQTEVRVTHEPDGLHASCESGEGNHASP